MDRLHCNRRRSLAIAIGMTAIGQCGRQEWVETRNRQSHQITIANDQAPNTRFFPARLARYIA